MICPECESENVEIIDDSFDYGEGHHGPAGTRVIKYPKCKDCGHSDDDWEDPLEDDDWEEYDD